MENQGNKFGFTAFAENWNGRLAMLGFIIAVATELLTGKGILAQLGLM
ncbi:MAG: chlorophyll a/b-binding protein [Xenococcaceae cyanobacterium MO_207.B15]|nr:chlorophyll a/b-binding protein [Xenococcaceae cyanobacterium MO_207.B15]